MKSIPSAQFSFSVALGLHPTAKPLEYLSSRTYLALDHIY